ncbi:hypothetical protein [Arthrobacter sp. H41]|uniref:hypothetical protein n=1 Tax=Arthrobacter sp. H41 TaxID=1312978 RepID=UPI0004B8D4C4|nr:hypothetical protein [Arthrobacter sp. H41]
MAAVFDNQSAQVDHIEELTVLEVEPMVLVPGRDRMTGTWTVTQPAPEFGDLRGEVTRTGFGLWAHLMARVMVTAVLQSDGAGIDTVAIGTIEDITSFADFESRFRYIDMDEFLETHRITTLDQLRQSGPYLLADIRLKELPPFDPQDAANAIDVAIDIAIVIQDELDLTAGLVAARQLWNVGAGEPPGVSSAVLGPTSRPFAVAVAFPSSVLGAGQPTAAAIDSLYAAAKVLPLFANPP